MRFCAVWGFQLWSLRFWGGASPRDPPAPRGPAGTTGRHYAGDGYRVAQSAQQQARRVAAAYALRPVASWPIKALSMHCVVYEITDGRPVAEVLAALSKDSRVEIGRASCRERV